MNIENNNEIVNFTNYLLGNNYTVNPASGEAKRKYLIAHRGDEFYMIEHGALGSDAEGYGIYRIQNPEARTRVSEIVPITEFDPARGIAVNS
ncbi:hypothetical protein [Nafulsella turpanensis]|uniref:hypothetical protein n=1 Tax=Nafulsella turpanensis TaxID=1265690 RepID=UPI000347ACE8|nr:hypothetical protein [Nafulsella turpanensis]